MVHAYTIFSFCAGLKFQNPRSIEVLCAGLLVGRVHKPILAEHPIVARHARDTVAVHRFGVLESRVHALDTCDGRLGVGRGAVFAVVVAVVLTKPRLCLVLWAR